MLPTKSSTLTIRRELKNQLTPSRRKYITAGQIFLGPHTAPKLSTFDKKKARVLVSFILPHTKSSLKARLSRQIFLSREGKPQAGHLYAPVPSWPL